MLLSCLIRKKGCNVEVDPPLQHSKSTSFNKHTFGCTQYVMDTYGNNVKKLGKELEQPKPKRQPKREGQLDFKRRLEPKR